MLSNEDQDWINEAIKITQGDNMDSFLPDTYEVPSSSGNYMKFQQGQNRFRILSSPILGYEWWVDSEDGKRQPKRIPMMGNVPVEFAEEVKHFWAMVVWNYKLERVQILEITQKTIQKAIKSTVATKWGDPKGVDGYDFVVTKEGEKKDTEYTIMPEPKEKLDPKIIKQYEDMKINLEALYEGADPFAQKGEEE